MAGLRKLTTPEVLVDEGFLRALSSGLMRELEDHGRGSLGPALANVLDDIAVDAAAGALKRGGGVASASLDAGEHPAGSGPTAPPSPATSPTSSAPECEPE